MMISFVNVFRGFFQGMQNMTHTGVSQILEQMGRVIVGVGMAIILLPKGIEYSAGGASLGAAGGGVLALAYLYLKYSDILFSPLLNPQFKQFLERPFLVNSTGDV